MATVLERVSTITGKGQTTVPKPVRDALGVGFGGRIKYRVDEHGVTLLRADDHDADDDPALGAFLALLARDMQERPQRIAALSPKLAQRIAALIEGVDCDPAEAIEGDAGL